jgi:hypothetical protein
MIRNKPPNKARAFGLLEGPLGGVPACENDLPEANEKLGILGPKNETREN